MTAGDYTSPQLEGYRENIEALDKLGAWLGGEPGREVWRMKRGPLGWTVSLRREDGKLCTAHTQLTLASAIRTAIMIARYP